MNYINCKNYILPGEMRKAVLFWAENTFQHINSLSNSVDGTPAVLHTGFKTQLKELYNSFKNIAELYAKDQNTNLSVKPATFFKENQKFINLLERIKFEGFNGYPDLQQTIFHYLYEQRYANAIFNVNSNSNNNIITTKYNNPGNHPYICIYNQMYFWSIIGAMHPSLLSDTSEFYEALTSNSKAFLIDISNRFNALNFELSSLKKPIIKCDILKVFEQFEKLNSAILHFLKQAKTNSPKIYSNPFGNGLPKAFYEKLQHMINEHTLVSELNCTISQKLG